MENKEKYKYVDENVQIAKILFNQLSNYELTIDNIEKVIFHLDNFIKIRSKVKLKTFE